MLDVTIKEDHIQIGDRFRVSFLRTLRIPDDGQAYPLPPGLGSFPLLQVNDYLDRVPSAWRKSGGAFFPMYQREALWMGFHCPAWKPCAVKVAIGSVNALTGEADDNVLHARPQNYIVCPNQMWLDGVHLGSETIRQFVAMPLGSGYTVESGLSGEERHGGIQITVFEPKPGQFPDSPPPVNPAGPARLFTPRRVVEEMGIGAGGVMQQKIYPDPYDFAVWDPCHYGRVCVHIVNSLQFRDLVERDPPLPPIDARTYTHYGFPWFALYEEEPCGLEASPQLSSVKTIRQRDAELGTLLDSDKNLQIPGAQIRKIVRRRSVKHDRSTKR